MSAVSHYSKQHREDAPPRLRGAEVEDAQHRLAYPGHPLRSAYLSTVGEPVDCGPSDTKTAEQVLMRVEDAIAKGGWTRAEWARLYRMRIKWRRRSKGEDLWFNLMGTKGGSMKEVAAGRGDGKMVQALRGIRRLLDAEKSEA
jgi:hypothetical protein